MRRIALFLLLVLVACGDGEASTPVEGELPTFDPAAFQQRLDDSERPAVVNVWASWCIPCRSEAPLLTSAHEQYGDRIDFIGIAIQDTQPGAAEFIEEFGITYENLFDVNADIRGVMGGSGVPITYFVAPGGALVETHFGIIDEGQLALAIDELLASTGS
jgi:cytochrome c biogenesis protein CcmG, thiol:disulfide interchange protein DsbE